MGIAGAFIHRGVGRISPVARVRLARIYEARRGEFGLVIARRLVRKGDVAVDIGASYGLYTDLLSGLVGQSGQVHSIEAEPRQVEDLKRVARSRANIVVHECAASDRDGKAKLKIPTMNGERMGSRATLRPLPATVQAEEVIVPTRPLDAIVTSKVAFIKCDTEGHELAVLRGGQEILREHRPSLLIELDVVYLGAAMRDVVDYLTGLGYEGYGLVGGRLQPIGGIDILDLDRSAADATAVDNFLFVQPELRSTRFQYT